LTVQGYIGP